MRDLAQWRSTPFGVVVPKYAVPVTAIGFVQVAAYGTQSLIVQYQAKADYYVMICGLVFGFTAAGAGGPAPNPGDAAFAIDIDRPLASTAGYPVKDYGAESLLLGSFSPGDPWPCDIRFENDETIRVKATAIANMGTGLGNWFTAALLGYEWPKGGFEG